MDANHQWYVIYYLWFHKTVQYNLQIIQWSFLEGLHIKVNLYWPILKSKFLGLGPERSWPVLSSFLWECHALVTTIYWSTEHRLEDVNDNIYECYRKYLHDKCTLYKHLSPTSDLPFWGHHWNLCSGPAVWFSSWGSSQFSVTAGLQFQGPPAWCLWCCWLNLV